MAIHSMTGYARTQVRLSEQLVYMLSVKSGRSLPAAEGWI
jgi:hypothetical protein